MIKNKKLISTWKLIPNSYRIALKNYEQILILLFIPSLILVLSQIFITRIIDNPKLNNTDNYVIVITLIIIWLIASIINYPASIYLRLHANTESKSPSIKECYVNGFKQYKKVMLSLIILWVAVIIGLALLIIPGILIFRRYCFVSYVAIENPKLSIKDIFKRCSEITKPYIYYIYGTFGVLILAQLVSSLLFGYSLIGIILVYLVNYFFIFVPPLRYNEIISYKN